MVRCISVYSSWHGGCCLIVCLSKVVALVRDVEKANEKLPIDDENCSILLYMRLLVLPIIGRIRGLSN